MENFGPFLPLSSLSKEQVTLLGVTQSLGQGKKGVEEAPQFLRQRGVKELLQENFKSVVDLGDFRSSSQEEWFDWKGHHLRNPWATGIFCEQLAQFISQTMDSETFPLILGGDHSQAIGVIEGLERVKSGRKVLWIDAHADINTLTSSLSGNLHGMPLSVLLGLEPQNPFFEWCKSPLRPENIVLLGIREVDQGEWKILEEKKIRYYTAQDLKKRGMDRVLDEALDALLGQGSTDLHVELDVDVFDPNDLQTTGTLAPQGPTKEEMMVLARRLREAPLSSLEIVEFNPLLGNSQEQERGLETLMSFMKGLFCRPYPQGHSGRVTIPLKESLLRES